MIVIHVFTAPVYVCVCSIEWFAQEKTKVYKLIIVWWAPSIDDNLFLFLRLICYVIILIVGYKLENNNKTYDDNKNRRLCDTNVRALRYLRNRLIIFARSLGGVWTWNYRCHYVHSKHLLCLSDSSLPWHVNSYTIGTTRTIFHVLTMYNNNWRRRRRLLGSP